MRSIDDLKLAPFHLLATEGSVHTDKQHGWHMEKLIKLCAQKIEVALATPSKIVDVNGHKPSCDQAAEWWQALTSAGGEGMVVKPLDFISKGPAADTLSLPSSAAGPSICASSMGRNT